MSDFPIGGDEKDTRVWLDKEGFIGYFIDWCADAILDLNKSTVLSMIGSDNKGLRLWGTLNIARWYRKNRPKDVNVGKAVNLPSHYTCSHFLEQFAHQFVVLHNSYNHDSGCCSIRLTTENCQSSVFQHLEECKGISTSSLIIDELSMALKDDPHFYCKSTDVTYLKLCKQLYSLINNNAWFRDSIGDIIVPYDLDPPTKRCLIRFLEANGKSVVIADANATLRDPTIRSKRKRVK